MGSTTILHRGTILKRSHQVNSYGMFFAGYGQYPRRKCIALVFPNFRPHDKSYFRIDYCADYRVVDRRIM